jgi:CheY-like chemotaxis protein
MNVPQPKTPEVAKGAKPLIYVVDDEPMLLELATVILEPLGYAIQTFRDPGSALKSFSAADPRPDLVITDYAMHSMHGLALMDACRQLRPGQKVLLVSGTVDESVYRGSAAKPDGFLAKPYQAKRLVDAVRNLLLSHPEKP